MKKILRVVIVVVAVLVIGILSISYLDNHNQETLDNMIKMIQENYNVTEEITYANQYGNYYILKTPSQVIVLTKEFNEVLKENNSALAPNINNYDLIYKTNQLMYEKTIREKRKLTYVYYDAKTNEEIKTTTMEQK